MNCYIEVNKNLTLRYKIFWPFVFRPSNSNKQKKIFKFLFKYFNFILNICYFLSKFKILSSANS